MCTTCNTSRQDVIDFDVDDFIQTKTNEHPDNAYLLNDYRSRLLGLQTQALATHEDVSDQFEQTIHDVDAVLQSPPTDGFEDDEVELQEQAEDDAIVAEMEWKAMLHTEGTITPMDPEDVQHLFQDK